MKVKVLCPNSTKHNDHDKILMVYDSSVRTKQRFWVPCAGCRKWIQIDVNELGGVNTKIIPKNKHFQLELVPSIAEVLS